MSERRRRTRSRNSNSYQEERMSPIIESEQFLFTPVIIPSSSTFQPISGKSSPISISSSRSSSPYSSDSEREENNASPYAGAKFNSPPPAEFLPVPPTTWLLNGSPGLNGMSLHLRQLLNVES